MKKYVRTKLVFTGTEETLKPLMQKLTSADGSAPISFAAIIPPNDAGMEESWGVSREPEELDSILCHNNTVLEYSFDTLEKSSPSRLSETGGNISRISYDNKIRI